MSLRFLVDEDMPLSLVGELEDMGHDAVHVRHVGLLGRADTDVFMFAQSERRILVTRDLGFGDSRLYPLGSHAGVIVLRVPTTYVAGQLVALVKAFLAEADWSSLAGSLVILRPTGYRIRQTKAP